ncbi:hypothetical protein Noda2021_08950 [Candidatus Dependentiae bacterium Noda2021]|nr:hypothetical protein Noda2021_08950 [Candidatus Dependentiae bacterium Noda2021]
MNFKAFWYSIFFATSLINAQPVSNQDLDQEPTKEELVAHLKNNLGAVAEVAQGFNHSFFIFKNNATDKDWKEFITNAKTLKHAINASNTLTPALVTQFTDLLKSAMQMGLAMQPSIDLIAEEIDLSTANTKNINDVEIILISCDLLKKNIDSKEWFNFISRSVDHSLTILGDESLPEVWFEMVENFITTNMNISGISPKLSVLFLDPKLLK